MDQAAIVAGQNKTTRRQCVPHSRVPNKQGGGGWKTYQNLISGWGWNKNILIGKSIIKTLINSEKSSINSFIPTALKETLKFDLGPRTASLLPSTDSLVSCRFLIPL